MTAGADVADRLEREAARVDLGRPQELRHHLQHLGVQDKLLEGRAEPALEPAEAVHDEVGMPQDAGPDRHLGLVDRLAVGGVGGVHVGGAEGHAVAARELGADQGRLGVFRRAEGRRARFHVDVGGEAAVNHRRTGHDDLGEGDAGERFGVLLDHGARHGDRRHGACEGEGRDDEQLLAARHLDHPLQHGDVVLQRRIGVDDGVEVRPLGELFPGEPARDPPHLQMIARPHAAQAVAEAELVGEANGRQRDLEVADVGRDVERLHRAACRQVADVEALGQADEVAEVGERSGPAPTIQARAIGRPAHGPEVDVVGAEGEIVLRIAGAGVNQRRRPGDRFRNQGPVEADAWTLAFHIRPGLAQDLAGLGQEEVHPDLLEHLHGGLMDRLDLLGGDDLHRRIGICEPAPRQLHEGRLLAAAHAAAASSCRAGLAHSGTLISPGLRVITRILHGCLETPQRRPWPTRVLRPRRRLTPPAARSPAPGRGCRPACPRARRPPPPRRRSRRRRRSPSSWPRW